jgi:Mrp family chromosome partitioning ATPase
LSLQRQVRAILRRMPYILLAVVLVAFPVYLYMNSRTKIYEASSTVLVGEALQSANPDYLGLEVAQYLAGTYAYLAETDPLLDQVIEQLGLPYTSLQLREAITATVRDGNPVLTIAVRDPDPTIAASISNAIVAQLVAASPTFSNDDDLSVESQLRSLRDEIARTQGDLDALLAAASPPPDQQAQVEQLRDRLLNLQSTYTTLLGYSTANGSNHLTILASAVPPASWVEPRPIYFTAVAVAATLVIAVALAYVFAMRDDRLREAIEVEDATGMPILAAIPATSRSRKRAPRIHPAHSAAANSIDALRIGIEAFVPNRGAGVSIVVLSATEDPGNSETAANLAISLAGSSGNVLLVDANLLRPQQHLLFEVENRVGLATLLRRDDTSHVGDFISPTRISGLRLLPAGSGGTETGWTGSGVFKRLLPSLRSACDVLVFDVPPLDASTIGLALAAETSTTVLVARLGVTTRSSLREACNRLDLVGANVLGVAVQGLRTIPPATLDATSRARPPSIDPTLSVYRTPPHAG